jgi:hypothetical protein
VSRGTRVRGSESRARVRLPGSHRLWRLIPQPSTHASIGNSPGSNPTRVPQPRAAEAARFGLLPVRSPLLGESRLFSFPRGTEMFQFPRFASPTYVFSRRSVGITPRGFPHSGIRGSQPACGSPRLFAACHALHRFLAPRHPPSALLSLTTVVRDRVTACRRLLKTLWLLEDLVCGCQRADARSRPAPARIFPAPGGDDRNRTGDPLLAKQVLSRLSYIPPSVVGLGRVELPTSRLSGARSNHLSYRPGKNATGSAGEVRPSRSSRRCRRARSP